MFCIWTLSRTPALPRPPARFTPFFTAHPCPPAICFSPACRSRRPDLGLRLSLPYAPSAPMRCLIPDRARVSFVDRFRTRVRAVVRDDEPDYRSPLTFRSMVGKGIVRVRLFLYDLFNQISAYLNITVISKVCGFLLVLFVMGASMWILTSLFPFLTNHLVYVKDVGTYLLAYLKISDSIKLYGNLGATGMGSLNIHEYIGGYVRVNMNDSFTAYEGYLKKIDTTNSLLLQTVKIYVHGKHINSLQAVNIQYHDTTSIHVIYEDDIFLLDYETSSLELLSLL